MSILTIERKVLEKNDQIAGRNRQFFLDRGMFVLNFVSSPGAGKTSILEKTFQELNGSMKIAVIEGDVQTDLDAQRVAHYGVPVVQIVTMGGCHLEANLIEDALTKLDLKGVEVLFIENVGNLVCPSSYDLGEAAKPLKYPAMFRNASILLINKIDLVPYVNCDLKTLRGNALQINPALKVFEISCFTGSGIPEWCHWLRKKDASGL
jgi:hydrogenase nickel incorporation protein HypB